MVHSPCLLSVLRSCPFLPAQPACLYLARCYEFQMLLFFIPRVGGALITCSTRAPGEEVGEGVSGFSFRIKFIAVELVVVEA